MATQLKLRLRTIAPGSLIWQPRKDITVLELATAMHALLLQYSDNPGHAHAAASMVGYLPPNVRRHWKYKLMRLK